MFAPHESGIRQSRKLSQTVKLKRGSGLELTDAKATYLSSNQKQFRFM